MQKLYPIGPRHEDVDHGIWIRTLMDKCPEFDIETDISKNKVVEGIISYHNSKLYFLMDEDEIIHNFSCKGDDKNHPIIELICKRLEVDWVKKEDYEKLVDEDKNLSNYALSPNYFKVEGNFDTIDLADLVQEKNRATQREKLEPRMFYRGVFRMFCQINQKPVYDTDEIWEASIVLYREFLCSKYNKSSFDRNDEISQINDFLNETVEWAHAKREAELPF